jgi:hypothetical protein
MATNTIPPKAQYRSNAVKLTAVANASIELLNLYTWQNGDGKVTFTNEPNIVAISDPALFDFEVQSRWHGLRHALIVAGLIGGEQVAGRLPNEKAQFLRVQALNLVTAGNVVVWQTVAFFEVCTGVNSYGYADGRALDLFYELEKTTAVRVVRHMLNWVDREDYLEGQIHNLIS